MHFFNDLIPLFSVLPFFFFFYRKEAVTLPGTGETNVADIEQSLQFSNTGTTNGFQHNAYFTMVCICPQCMELESEKN